MRHKTCTKCAGTGKLPLPVGANNDMPCWLCQCTGELPSPDPTAITQVVLRRGSFLPVRQLIAPFKQALSMIGKRGPWGKTPTTIEEAEALWKATIFGRRCTYVHMMVQHHYDPRIRKRHLIIASCKEDAYIADMDLLVEMLIAAGKANGTGNKR